MHGPVSYKFREQVIGFNVPSQRMTQIIARRIGQNGVLKLETLVPALFTGRVEVISSNNTLVIHDLQYNDSTCQFSSIVTVDADVGAGPKPNKFPISHQVKITVHGMKIFYLALVMAPKKSSCSMFYVKKLRAHDQIVQFTVLRGTASTFGKYYASLFAQLLPENITPIK